MIRRATGAAIVLAALYVAFITASAQSLPAGRPPGLNDSGSPYVGSEACARCHRPAYEDWKRSIHQRMTQPIASASVAAHFPDGGFVQGPGYRYAPDARGGRPSMSVSGNGRPAETFSIDYTLGQKRFQGYMSTLDDGRIYVLPLFWNVEWQRWLDWRELTPVPDSDHDRRQIWNVNCFNCHATNIQRNFDLRTRTFATTWTEMGVGCEACHGPGRMHVDRMLAWGKDPSAYPEIDVERSTTDLNHQLAIFTPRASMPRQVFDSCSYCHGNKTNHFVGFEAGNRFDDFAEFALASDPIPANDPQGEFWPDGRPSRFNRPQALIQSGCFLKGGATCVSCHAAHGSANEHSLKVALSDSNRLCTSCHQTVRATAPDAARLATMGPELTGHTHHAPDAKGSRCVECHMSDVNWRLLTRRRDHTFAPPVPEMTARFGVPNACTTCHEDRSPEWAASTMDRWYGDRVRRNRTLETAEAIYAGGSGDRAATRALVALVSDRTRGPLIRASAAGFVGRLLAPGSVAAGPTAETNPASDAAIIALIAAASDSESTVRIAAVRSLGALGTDAAVAALVARLSDPSRVVRATAAEALLVAGVIQLPGPNGAALAQAQAEYAESLRTFGDLASGHTSLGWLLAARGQNSEAERELKLAVSLDPADARPRVYLGVLSARAGRYDEAIANWKAARELNPSYPNIKRLIDEATARRLAR